MDGINEIIIFFVTEDQEISELFTREPLAFGISCQTETVGYAVSSRRSPSAPRPRYDSPELCSLEECR